MIVKNSKDSWYKKRRRYSFTRKGIIVIFLLIALLLIMVLSLSYSTFKLKSEKDTYLIEIENLQFEVSRLSQQNNDLISEISDLMLHNEHLTSESNRLGTLVSKKSFNISSEDFKLLARVVYCEAGAEPYEGQVAVARVVLNRWIGDKWKDKSIKEVIYHPGQFNQILSKINTVSPTELNYSAVVDAINNTIDMPVDVDSFETISSGTQNGSAYRRWKTIGNHNFNILK